MELVGKVLHTKLEVKGVDFYSHIEAQREKEYEIPAIQIDITVGDCFIPIYDMTDLIID